METIHRIELQSMHGLVNVYLLKGPVLTLVDAGADLDICYEQLIEQLKKHQLRMNDIKQVILTHLHADHVGLLSKIMKQSNASVFVNIKARYSFINKGEPLIEHTRQETYLRNCFERWGVNKEIKVWSRFYPHAVDMGRIRYLQEGDQFFAGDRFYHVIETPGHSQVDICLYNEGSNTFIGGDLLLPTITPVAYIESPFPNEIERAAPLVDYMTSLKKVPLHKGMTIYPGHGPIFNGADIWITQRLQKIENKCERIYSILKNKREMTVFQISQAMNYKNYKRIPYTVLSDVVGHLDLLERRKLIQCHVGRAINYYGIPIKV